MARRLLSLLFVACAYNAGSAADAQAGGAPTGETLSYVREVTTIWRRLAGCR